MIFRRSATKCPLCGGSAIHEDGIADPNLLVCQECSEIIYRSELVTRATWRTRRTYLRNNNLWHTARTKEAS